MGANYRRLGWPSLWGLHQDTPLQTRCFSWKAISIPTMASRSEVLDGCRPGPRRVRAAMAPDDNSMTLLGQKKHEKHKLSVSCII